jgi:hypothetical protein
MKEYHTSLSAVQNSNLHDFTQKLENMQLMSDYRNKHTQNIKKIKSKQTKDGKRINTKK